MFVFAGKNMIGNEIYKQLIREYKGLTLQDGPYGRFLKNKSKR